MLGLLLGLHLAFAGEVFVDVDEAQLLVEAGAAVVDARGKREWAKGHIPGAWPVSWTDQRDGLLRVGRLTHDLEDVAAQYRVAGVRQDAPVLVVGAAGSGWGEEGRLFWTLEYLGHPDVHVLDGGMTAWSSAGGATVTEGTRPPPGDLSVSARSALRASMDEVAAGEAVVWDTRERREYDGATPYLEARGGHVPGAVHLWFRDLMDPEGRLLPEAELRKKLDTHGIPMDEPVIALCTGGVRSGFAYAVLRHLDHPEVANYDGSMWEWTADKSRPLD